MKTIWVKVSDGDNVSACSTKKKALGRIKERYDCSDKEARERLDDEWQEVYMD